MNVTPRTRFFGVLGQPVAHSLSPALHNAAFRVLGIDARYGAFEVGPDRFGAAVAGARALGFGGLNVTVPHKERALAAAQEAAPEATQAGAANTLVPCAAGWRAHNTDVEGLLRGLERDLGFRAGGRRCLVLGAGGAARAALVAFLREGAQEIRVANRNGDRAARLAARFQGAVSATAVAAVELAAAPEGLEAGDLLVSATPLGLTPEGRWPWALERLSPGVRVYDMAYRAGGETPLVEQARAAGLTAASGRSMLLFQGAAAFSLWTGRPAPLEAMEQALLAAPAAPAGR